MCVYLEVPTLTAQKNNHVKTYQGMIPHFFQRKQNGKKYSKINKINDSTRNEMRFEDERENKTQFRHSHKSTNVETHENVAGINKFTEDKNEKNIRK